MAEEKQKKGAFWGALIGTALISILSSNVLSTSLTQDAAKEEAAGVEKSFADYINEEVEPKIVDAFKSVDQDINDIDEDLAKCQAEVREIRILSETALRLAERSVGRRTVERVMDSVDRPKPAPPPKAIKRPKELKFNPYEQRAQAPEQPFEPPPMGD